MGALSTAGEGSNPNFSKRLVIIFKSCAVEVTQRTWRFLRNILVTLKLLHSSIFLSLTIQLNFLLLFSPLQRSIKKSISAFHKNLIKLGNKQKYLKAKFQISKLIEKHFLWFLVEWKDGGNNDDDEDGDVIKRRWRWKNWLFFDLRFKQRFDLSKTNHYFPWALYYKSDLFELLVKCLLYVVLLKQTHQVDIWSYNH